ncbi:MAG: HAMP domain-containing sensor histidine kinase [Myxococcota bacterium]
MRRRRLRSIRAPIIMGAISVPLSVALLVGWTLLIARNLASADNMALDVSLLVAGALSFLVIVAVIVLLSLFLVREILEVRRQDSFIDSVTHELKSPLASIRLALETLGRQGLAGDKREELRTMMLDDVARLSAFIDDVLQASQIVGGSEGIQALDEIELRTMVEAMRRDALDRWHLPEDAVELDVPDLTVALDGASLTIVLRNLIDNAIKYGGERPRVRVRGVRSAKGLSLEVSDSGIGIERQHLKRVFERFFRGTSADVRKRHGTGLGLFVANALTKGLGGTLSAHSGGLGQGTTMRLVLPHKVVR